MTHPGQREPLQELAEQSKQSLRAMPHRDNLQLSFG